MYQNSGALRISGFPRRTFGNRTSSCTTGLCGNALPPFSQLFHTSCSIYLFFLTEQCWRGLRRNVQDQRRRQAQWILFVRASRHIQEHLQDRYHVVSIRRPEVWDEIRIVDVRRFPGNPNLTFPTYIEKSHKRGGEGMLRADEWCRKSL